MVCGGTNLIWVGELELPAVPGPGDELLAGLVRQQLQQELPKLDRTRALEFSSFKVIKPFSNEPGSQREG